jgi:hypothetical protein
VDQPVLHKALIVRDHDQCATKLGHDVLQKLDIRQIQIVGALI